jgi:hypothetical protein
LSAKPLAQPFAQPPQAEEKLRREAEERRKKAKESAVHREKMRTTTGAGKVGVGERIAI